MQIVISLIVKRKAVSFEITFIITTIGKYKNHLDFIV
jgi:hypothetical protein